MPAFILSLLLFVLTCSPLHAGQKWQTGYIDKAYRCETSSLQIAAEGTEYIAIGGSKVLDSNVFIGDDLVLAMRSPGGQWSFEEVDADPDAIVGINPSLALDSSGQPHISYFDGTNGRLKYASFNGSTWSITVVDIDNPAGGPAGVYSSLTLDGSDRPRISYWGDGAIKYASWNGSSWAIITVAATGTEACENSLALDSSDYPHISYYESGNKDLGYSYFTGTAWVHQSVDSTGSVGKYNSLALDSTDKPRISYYDETNLDLKYAVWTGSAWSVNTLATTGNIGLYTSLALDTNDNYIITYYDNTNDRLWMSSWNGSFGLIFVVSEGSGQFSSLTLDQDGKSRISHYAQNEGSIKLSTYSTGWTTETVLTGRYPQPTSQSLAVAPNGTPGAVYTDQGRTYDLFYASFDGTDWTVQTVDTDPALRMYTPSLAFDTNSRPHISYVAGSTLRYATHTGSAWSITTVDASGSVGGGSSIALDSANKPRISYGEYISTDVSRLKYAAWTGSAWTTETVPQTVNSDLSGQTSLALTSTNEPIIAYFDMSGNRPVRLAVGSGGGWTIYDVEELPGVTAGARPSLALGASNTVHLSYYHYNAHTDSPLRYATGTPASLILSTIVSDSSSNESLALDKEGNPVVSYRAGGLPCFARRNPDGSWSTSRIDSQKAWDNSIAFDKNGTPWVAYQTALKSDLVYAVGSDAFPWTMFLPGIITGTP